ncbi:MAG: hypothetical protein WCP55_18675 [Lentisphaerota bacterium]
MTAVYPHQEIFVVLLTQRLNIVCNICITAGSDCGCRRAREIHSRPIGSQIMPTPPGHCNILHIVVDEFLLSLLSGNPFVLQRLPCILADVNEIRHTLCGAVLNCRLDQITSVHLYSFQYL